MNENRFENDAPVVGDLKFRSEVIGFLTKLGISEATRNLIVDNYFEKSCKELHNSKNWHCFKKVLINFLVECIQELKTYETEIPILITFLVSHEHKLSQFDFGRLLHMKAIKAWKIDSNIYFSLHYLNKSLELFAKLRTLQAKGYLPRIYDTFGQLLTSQGALIEARDEFMRALEGRKILNDLQGKALTLGNLGRLSMQIGDFKNAIKYLEEDYNIVERIDSGNKGILGQLSSTICICYLELGEFAKAKEFNENSHRINLQSNNTIGLIFNKLNAAQIAIKEGNVNITDDLLAELNDEMNRTNIYTFVREYIKGKILHLKALALFYQNSFDESHRYFEKALEVFVRELSISPVETAHLLHDYAQLAAKFNNTMLAGKLYRQSLRYLDTTEEHRNREIIEAEMKSSFKDSWILHSAGRFLGHEQISFLLEEAGKGYYAGEEKEVVVLFTDIRGFTSLTEKLPPKQLIKILNGFLSIMTKAIETFGGFIDKFIGDSIMAIFTLPEPHPNGSANDSENAVMAALLMKEELIRFNRNLPDDIPDFKIGIGIHSGIVTAGLIGSPQKRSYTVIGDVANTASRMEGMTKMLGAEILISQSVHAHLTRDDIILRDLGRYCPKGRENFVEVFEVLGLDDGSPRLKSLKEECRIVKEALDCFYKRDFTTAEKLFNQLIEKSLKKDWTNAYRILSHVCLNSKNKPPDESWQGEIVLDRK